MRRFAWALLVLVPFVTVESWLSPASTTAQAVDPISLEQTLIVGLRARTTSERTFLKRVATYVKDKKLPRELVMKAFRYVRKRHRFENRKVFVFQQTLRKLVKAERIQGLNI